jgi:AraC-like DNA-binding protein
MPSPTTGYSSDVVMVPIGPSMGVPAALHSLGFDPQAVLSEGGFDIGIFDQADNLIAFSARGRLLAHCVRKTKCPYFGLLVGEQSGLGSLGLVGLLVQHSPDVRTAINNLIHYFHLVTHGAMISLEEGNGIAVLSYHVTQIESTANDQVGAGAVAVMLNLVRDLCGPVWQPREAWFMFQQPVNTAPYRKFFQTHLQFNADQNAIVFLSSWLNRPVKEAHPKLYELVQQQIDSLEARQGYNFTDQVSEVLRAAILRGNCTADRVAALFSMHPRTLHRRLKSSGVGYQELVDAVSYSLAEQLLTDTNLTVHQIAINLHYADARSFIRAFQRWTGTTPARWRARQK